jgi:hypothetical protein
MHDWPKATGIDLANGPPSRAAKQAADLRQRYE